MLQAKSGARETGVPLHDLCAKGPEAQPQHFATTVPPTQDKIHVKAQVIFDMLAQAGDQATRGKAILQTQKAVLSLETAEVRSRPVSSWQQNFQSDNRVETTCLGVQKLQLPKETVWLNGAPGSGKGVNTPFILESRGLSRAVSMSSLFQQSEEIRQYMDRGELVPDTMVSNSVV